MLAARRPAGRVSAGRAKRSHRSARTRPRNSWTIIKVPAIIDDDTFALAHQRPEQGVRFASRNAKRPSLFRGLLVCRECGYAWHQVEKGKPHSRRIYYMCGSRSLRTAERRCQSPMVRAEELDQLVWEEIRRLLCEPDLVRGEIDGRLRSMRENRPRAAAKRSLPS